MAKRTCSVDGCPSPHGAKGFCDLHYQRMKTYGSTDDPRIPREQRFWKFVDKNGPLPSRRPYLGPCWLWTGCILSNGYGQFRADDLKDVGAHVFSYKLDGGVVPRGWHVHHMCEVRACVNPRHLRARTPWENAMDSLTAPSAVNARKTHCIRGHPFDAENTYHPPKEPRKRKCKACMREANRQWRSRGDA